MQRHDLKNLLVVRNDRFGEFILTVPAIKTLRSAFASAKITLLVSSAVAELISCSGLADDIVDYDSLGIKGVMPLRRWMKDKGFDSIVIFNPSKEFNTASFLAGLKVRLGYDRKYGFLLNHRIPDLKSSAVKHEVLYNLDLLKPLDIAAAEADISFGFCRDDEVSAGKICLQAGLDINDVFIALHPFTSDPVKQWPLDNFVALSRMISKAKVVFIGGRQEAVSWAQEGFAARKAVDLVGKLSLRQTGVLLKRCSLLVSSDSGPVHLAASQGAKVCVLFRNDLSGKGVLRWGPWGSGHIVMESGDLRKITPEMVMERISGYL